jgi:hypothetical protein
MIPSNAVRITLRPLALGEVSGHHHSLCSTDSSVALDDIAEMYEVKDDVGTTTYLRIIGDCVALVHQEHKASLVAPGEYRVVLQQECTDWGSAPVRD